MLRREFAYGAGVRKAARMAGCHRDTAMRYRRELAGYWSALQDAYDALWDHECERCDAILETLPDGLARLLLDVNFDDQFEDDPKKRSLWHRYENLPQAPAPPAGKNEDSEPRQVPGRPCQQGRTHGQHPFEET